MKMILCTARHAHKEITGLEAMFTADIQPMDIDTLGKTAISRVVELERAGCLDDGLDLYVTGLSTALIAVIRACIVQQVSLCCWHYDRDNDTYVPQNVNTAMWYGCLHEGGYI